MIGIFTLICLRVGERALNAWLSVLAISMNVLILKQIHLFGLDVTATDSLAVGYMLGLNLLQENFGKPAARKHVGIAFLCGTGFTIFSQLHLAFESNTYDYMQEHYQMVLGTLPRIVGASFISFVTVQLLDINFFEWLRTKFGRHHLTFRIFLSLILSQVLDTLIFSYLGLYGMVEKISHIILLSLILKVIIIFLSLPYSWVARHFSVKRVYTQTS